MPVLETLVGWQRLKFPRNPQTQGRAPQGQQKLDVVRLPLRHQVPLHLLLASAILRLTLILVHASLEKTRREVRSEILRGRSR